jgi:CheY-like chemotaxis protein
MKHEKEYYTIPQAAIFCSLSRATLWRCVRSGDIKTFYTPGGHHRILPEEMEKFMRKNKMFHLIPKALTESRILIVDDEEQIRNLLSAILSKEGYAIEEASDGFYAGVKVSQFKPDLIILDLNMPNMDGFEVCENLKKDPVTKDIKIVILTGFDFEENREKVMKSGADLFLTKPVERSVLVNHIKDLLNY